jgi:D-alanine-D-alanine ligase-like ATP-grasp enzyme
MNKKILFLGRESPSWIGLSEKQNMLEFQQGYSIEMANIIDILKNNDIDYSTYHFKIGNNFSELRSIFKKSGADIVFSDFYTNLAENNEEKWIFDELERLRIPHYLSSSDTMKLMYSKISCQEKLKSAGIEVLPFISVDVNNLETLDKFIKKHKRIILKPSQGYSSKGIGVFEDFKMAMKHLKFLHSKKIFGGKIIAEKFLEDKKEYQILILGKKPELFPVEVGIPRGVVYDSIMKEEHITRDVVKSVEKNNNLKRLGENIYDIVGIRDIARIDVVCDSENNLYPIDVNGIPYFAKFNQNSGERASITQIGEIFGRSYESLILEILDIH